mgnify:CR=1 FL=1
MIRRLAALLLAALILTGGLAACAPQPSPANPALWRVDAPGGGRAWLFGTIHALDRPALWRTPAVDRAMADADSLVVEVAALNDATAMTQAFARLSTSPGLPPLSARVSPELRDDLARALDKGGLDADRLTEMETWAAALTLARGGGGGMDPRHGIDRALLAEPGHLRVVELEGAGGQLAIFDALPEAEQRDLLNAVLRDADALDAERGGLSRAWLAGDMDRIAAETRRGLLADAELREALYTARNRRWADRIAAMVASDARPFVAVGAAHMAGPQGLPALLAAQGFAVTRVQ